MGYCAVCAVWIIMTTTKAPSYVTLPNGQGQVIVDSNGNPILSTLPFPLLGVGTPSAPPPVVTTTAPAGVTSPTPVSYPAPISGFSYRLFTGNLVSFNNLSRQASSWQWYTDGTLFSTQQNPLYFYSSTGTKSVKLRAFSPAGTYTDYTANVVVTSIAAAANFSFVYDSLSMYFFDTSTTYGTAWLWNFGDGTTSTLQNPKHSYSAYGTYAVSLTVNGYTITQNVTLVPSSLSLLSSTADTNIIAVAQDATYIYVLLYSGTVQLRTKASPNAVYDSFATLAFPTGIAVDGTSIYVCNASSLKKY